MTQDEQPVSASLLFTFDAFYKLGLGPVALAHISVLLWPASSRIKSNKIAIGENCGEGLNTNHIVCWRFKAELLHGRRIHQILL